MHDFTPTQGRYLSFILAYTNTYGLPPAEADIAIAMKVSAPSANQMVRTLESKQLIQRQSGVPRSIEIKVDLDTIPEWNGKMPPRTEMVWAKDKKTASLVADAIIRARLDRREQMKLGRNETKPSTVYQFKIILKGASPPIWRRLETCDVSLEQFHQQIQRAMGWNGGHLHQFEIDGERYTAPEMAESDLGDQSYKGMKLSTIIGHRDSKFRFQYVYDFGDYWEHDVLLEKTFDSVPGVRYPSCSAGKRACPPEDVGGIPGYQDFLEAVRDPDHPEHKELLEWSGQFDPDEFDPVETSKLLQSKLQVW